MMPRWHVGDSRELLEQAAPELVDLVFTCPPYADLERYSDDPRDLSTMAYEDFLAAYREVISKACARLKDDRFACIVVGEVRDRDNGCYRHFVGDTVQAFLDAGLRFYNEAILVTAVGSLPIRTGKQFSVSRKLGKTHQNVLVFVKGDPRAAVVECGEVEIAQDLLDALAGDPVGVDVPDEQEAA
jgi:DNA modification methylase